MAEYVLNIGGVVYGCAMKDNVAHHVRVDRSEDLDILRRSKYVQSELGDTFKNIVQDLEHGLTVLYSGTPCQVAGLRLFLKKEYKNLYCIDLICHGVPSPAMFKKNIEWWEKRLKSRVEGYEFRLRQNQQVYSFFFSLIFQIRGV